jgi:HPt (histidine-containing phosphotransfer) domain-containing protein
MSQSFSLDYILSLVDDREMVVDLLQTFIDESPEDFEKLTKFASASDFKNCRILSHKLKSSMAIFKIEPLRTHFESIEAMCREESDIHTIQQMIINCAPNLESVYATIQEELQK